MDLDCAFPFEGADFGADAKVWGNIGKSPADLAVPGSCSCAVWVGGFVQALPGLISQLQQGWDGEGWVCWE